MNSRRRVNSTVRRQQTREASLDKTYA